MGADASHLTGADPHGATLSRLLKHVIHARSIDLIHAHGTGTVTNDPIELSAIESSLSPQHEGILPLLYSHKGALGHSLGAAGLVAVVINCLCHRHGVIPPNVHTMNPLPTAYVDIPVERSRRRVNRSLAVAAGFGGAVAAVTLTTS